MPSIQESFEQGEAESDEWKEQDDEKQSLINIFREDFEQISKNPDIFLITEEIMRLSRFLGRNRKKKVPILLSGPQGCGKSIAAQLIADGLKKYKVLYKAYDGHFDLFLSWWDETDFSAYDIVIFDNIYPIWDHFTRNSLEYLESQSDNILVVGILNSSESHWLQMEVQSSIIPFFNQENTKVFQFKRYSVHEIREMIKRRSESLGKPDFLSNDVVDTISILSLGLPGLALWLVRQLLSHQLYKDGLQDISVSTVHTIADYLGFEPALKLVEEHNLRNKHQEVSSRRIWPILNPLQQSCNTESSPLIQSLVKIKQVSKFWTPLLEEILMLNQKKGLIKRSVLQERTGVKESSLTYQCQRLVREKIITYSKEGREVYYQLRSPVKEALEYTFFG
ncbi:MAG: hypothetical protein ACFE95_04780 [Candidatus Hodarchaeota archaeon]